MKKSVYYYVVGLMLAIAVSGCTAPQKNTVTIAAAANMQYALTEIIEAYNAAHHTQHECVFSSSGKLNAQIKQGAPFDIFVSADMQYPTDLHESGFSDHPPQVYAFGSLVMWAYTQEFDFTNADLTSSKVHHIALANPRTAPYGRAAKTYLESQQLYTALTPKFVFGEGVGQTNQFIISGAAQIGFTAKSVVLSKQMKNKGWWKEIDHNLYAPIAQGLVIINSTKHPTEAQKVVDFMYTETAQNILMKNGYSLP